MSNRNYNKQTNPNRQKLMNGGRAKKNMGVFGGWWSYV